MRILSGSTVYKTHPLRYRVVDFGPGGAIGELRFDSEKAPVQQMINSDNASDAPLRELTLADGSLLIFHARRPLTELDVTPSWHTDIAMTIRIQGHIRERVR